MIYLSTEDRASGFEVSERRKDAAAGTSPDLRIWLRRRLILKVTLFLVCFVGVGLVLLLLDS